MSDDTKWFTVTPKSTAPEDIAAALIAEKIANSPAFIEIYKQRYRRLLSQLAETGAWVERWELEDKS